MGLSVTEKEHIKELFEKRIGDEIERIRSDNRIDMDQISERAKNMAIDTYGIRAEFDEARQIKVDIEQLQARSAELEKVMAERLGIVNRGYASPSISQRIDTLSKRFARDLAMQHPQLHRVVELETEKDKLMESVWIATSTTQVKQLFDAVNRLLGTTPTNLEKMAQDIPAAEE